MWTKIFKQSNAQYRPPTLVLYDNQVRSACGVAQSAMGPFYCPNDEKLYVDLSFFRELAEPLSRAPGDFAQAYVIAHEVGHHVQKLTGTMQQLESAARTGSQSDFGSNRVAGRLLRGNLGDTTPAQ
jgi:predicted metalloprotease